MTSAKNTEQIRELGGFSNSAKCCKLGHFFHFVTFIAQTGSRLSHWRGPATANAKNMEQISELRGSGGMPPGKFFFIMQNAAN